MLTQCNIKWNKVNDEEIKFVVYYQDRSIKGYNQFLRKNVKLNLLE